MKICKTILYSEDVKESSVEKMSCFGETNPVTVIITKRLCLFSQDVLCLCVFVCQTVFMKWMIGHDC